MNSDEIIGFADRTRGMIKHENELINHRLTWLLVIQGFLFTAVSILWVEKITAQNSLLMLLLSAIGLLSSISAYVSLVNAQIAIDSLVKKFETVCYEFQKEGKIYTGAPIIGLVIHEWWNNKLSPSYFIPTIFFIHWLTVAVLITASLI